MVNFDYKRCFFKIREMSFGTIKDLEQNKCDVVYMHSNDIPKANNELKNGVLRQEQYTVVNNLLQTEEELYSKISKTLRYEIRRGQKEQTDCVIYQDDLKLSDLNEFEKIYNEMFKSKKLRNRFNKQLVKEGLKKKNIVISKATNPDNSKCIVYHAYLVDGNSTLLMYSASTLATLKQKQDINMIGWMNKYLHWYDMKWFKSQGYSKYDWGGIGDINNLNGIARFKLCYGGEMVTHYNYLKSISYKGKLYVALVKRRYSGWK